MKTKRSRKDYSDDESDEPEQTWPAAPRMSSSDFLASSDGEVSKKNKKRRKKRESSSESESDASDKGSHKKRKHKKKKRKHSKKKRKEASSDDSESDSEDSSDASEESPVVKKKHKHKHRHSGKHSKKRRHDSDGETYPEKVPMSSERTVQQKPAQGHKMKSVCMGKEPRQSSVENIVSSEEEQARTRSGRREDTDRNTYKSRADNKEAHDHHRIKHPVSRSHQSEAGKSAEQPRQVYKESSRTLPQTDKYQSNPREKFEGGKYNTDKPQRNPDQYYDSTKSRDVKPRDDRPKDFRLRDDRPRDARLREERPRDDREFPNKYPDNNYNRYGDGNRQNFDRNGGNKFQKNKFEEESRDDRFAGQSNPHARDMQGERFDDRQQGFNRRPNNYQQQNYQHDQRHEGGYQKNNDFHNPRNDQRANRYQDKTDFSGGNHNTRRYESRDANERDNPVKREHSASSNRDVKQERRSDSRRVGSGERAPRAEFKREDREVSGATTRSRDRLRGSPDRPTRTRGSPDRPTRARGSPDRPARARGSPERPARTRGSPEPDMDKLEWGKPGATDKQDDKPQDKDKPNFGLSGKLTEDRNTVNGVVLKYSEPPEARQPKRRWRFYPFKGDKALSILYIHRQSCFLLGRDRKVCDIPLDHPSVSKQHAALQYRLVPFTREDGSKGKRVRPYIIDLGSANGTFVNNKKVDPSKYVELLERDVVKFGFSQREYVLLHENSKDDGMDDDDVKQGSLSDEGKARVKEEVSN